MEKFWMIVDVSVEYKARNYFDFELPSHKKPKYCFTDQERAETELLRLQEKHPGGIFVLMESIKQGIIGEYLEDKDKLHVFIETLPESEDG